MSIQQTLQKEIEESKRWLDIEKGFYIQVRSSKKD
jgi:hypothetical protein